MRIGVISDTHAFLDPRVEKLFAGVDHILHAGDVGPHMLLHELEAIAPVTAVVGNTDAGLNLKLTEVVELGGRKFLVHHIVNPHAIDDDLKGRIEREKPDVVVFGHTHKPFSETIDKILFFNPGYAGKQRFDLKRSLAVLILNGPDLKPDLIYL